jgi:hypothetical protein
MSIDLSAAVALIRQLCREGRPFPDIDQRVLAAHAGMTLEELSAAYQEAATRDLAEAAGLERFMDRRRQSADADS